MSCAANVLYCTQTDRVIDAEVSEVLLYPSGVTSNFGPPCTKSIQAPSSRTTQAYPELFIYWWGLRTEAPCLHRVEIETLRASRQEGYGQGCSLPGRLRGLGERGKLPQRGVRGTAPAENWFLPRDALQCKARQAYCDCMSSVRPSVCPSVTLVDQEHIGWKSWKLIARTISQAPSVSVAQRPSTYSQGNMEKFGGYWRWGVKKWRAGAQKRQYL